METLHVVFYHVKDILKGKELKTFALFACVSLIMELYTEMTQLFMDTYSEAFQVVSLLCSLLNIFILYTVLFVFIKAVRKETFTLSDIRYALSKIGMMIVAGLLLSFLQIGFMVATTFVQDIYPLYLVLNAIVYGFFLVWNAIVAYGIYDGVKFTQLLTGGVYIIKEHALEVFMSALFVMVWQLLGRMIVPGLTKMLLANELYAGLIVAGVYKGASLGVGTCVMILAVDLIYYGIQYVCMMYMYTYIAKIYNDERFHCMPSGLRFLHDDKQ